jgi:hypothetical protein
VQLHSTPTLCPPGTQRTINAVPTAPSNETLLCRQHHHTAHVLHPSAASCMHSEVVDIWRELGRMTLAVVGSAAYGVDFHTLSTGGQQDADAVRGTSLLAACAAVFASGGILSASKWVLLNAMLGAPRVVGWFARHLPDEPLRKLIAVRNWARPWRADYDSWPQHQNGILCMVHVL